jgi:outer membrane protein assembly factor BamB
MNSHKNKENGMPAFADMTFLLRSLISKITATPTKAGVPFCLAIATMLALTACGSTASKIGSTVKGTRVSILDHTKSLEADHTAQEIKPQVPDAVANPMWTQAGYDASHVMPNAAISDHPKVMWSTAIGEGSSSDFKILARPVVKDGMVYVMDAEGKVSGIGTSDGKSKWTLETTPEDRDESAIGGGVGVEGDTVYITTGFGEVIAVNAADGKVKWRHALLNPIRAAPTIASNRIYVVSIDNQLSALNANTGEVEWQHRGITEAATLMGASSPAVVGDSVIVAYASGEIYDLRAENGRVSWNYALTSPTQIGALPAIADIRGLPVVDRGSVFAISHSGRMASVDQRTGDRSWEADIGGINTPIVAGEAVFILSTDGQLVAMTRNNGRIIWVQELQHVVDPEDKSSDAVFWTGPVLAGGRLWLTNSMGQLAAFSPADGKQTDMIELENPIYMPPVIAGGIIYVVTDEGELIALK